MPDLLRICLNLIDSSRRGREALGRWVGPRARLELFFSCSDGKVQWEDEAAVNRLQSSEVPVSLGYPTWWWGEGWKK